MENLPIQNIFYIVGIFLFLRGSLYLVKQKQAVIIERLGKFNKVSKAGLNFKIPIIDTISCNVNFSSY